MLSLNATCDLLRISVYSMGKRYEEGRKAKMDVSGSSLDRGNSREKKIKCTNERKLRRYDTVVRLDCRCVSRLVMEPFA